MKEKITGEQAALFLLNIPILLAVGSIWTGYVLGQLWLWFVVPTFELPHLSWPAAYGLALIVRLASVGPSSNADKNRSIGEVVAAQWGYALGTPLLFLGMGWVVSRFM